jgi:hypothetical protein
MAVAKRDTLIIHFYAPPSQMSAIRITSAPGAEASDFVRQQKAERIQLGQDAGDR